jgi:hypothetical protein
MEYFDIATKAALKQVFDWFIFIFLLGLILHGVGAKLRSRLSKKMGDFYDYFILPGRMCHEFGRTLGCFLTSTKSGKFELFNLETDASLRIPVAASLNSKFAFLKRFVILSAPIWFGCFVVGVIAYFAAGSDFLPKYSECFPGPERPSVISYSVTLLMEAVKMIGSLVFAWRWTSPFCLLVFYILFCVGTQIKISGKSFLMIWRSILGIFFFVFLLNLVPGVNKCLLWFNDAVAPFLFAIHVTVLFVLFFNLSFLLLTGIFCRKKNRR